MLETMAVVIVVVVALAISATAGLLIGALHLPRDPARTPWVIAPPTLRATNERDLDRAYAATFGSPSGRLVFADLLTRAGVFGQEPARSSDGTIDPYRLAWNGGQRALAVMIAARVERGQHPESERAEKAKSAVSETAA